MLVNEQMEMLLTILYYPTKDRVIKYPECVLDHFTKFNSLLLIV